MTEETIERVFSPRDWNESFCDICTDRQDVVLLGDERVCRPCLLTEFDESGDKIVKDSDLKDAFSNDWQQKVKNAARGAAVAMFLAGFLLATFLFEHDEIAAIVRRFV